MQKIARMKVEIRLGESRFLLSAVQCEGCCQRLHVVHIRVCCGELVEVDVRNRALNSVCSKFCWVNEGVLGQRLENLANYQSIFLTFILNNYIIH